MSEPIRLLSLPFDHPFVMISDPSLLNGVDVEMRSNLGLVSFVSILNPDQEASVLSRITCAAAHKNSQTRRFKKKQHHSVPEADELGMAHSPI